MAQSIARGVAAQFRRCYDDIERRLVDAEISNGWHIDLNATPSTLTTADRARFALAPDAAYRTLDLSDGEWQGLVPGVGKGSVALSPWAVWATGRLLSAEECQGWISRAESLELEEGDFIFKQGKSNYERMSTGARRHSQTLLISDIAFAETIRARLLAEGGLPAELADGRNFRGVRTNFLLSKYMPGQYFAPHFDGCNVVREDVTDGALHGCASAFTCVLYLSDDFQGG